MLELVVLSLVFLPNFHSKIPLLKRLESVRQGYAYPAILSFISILALVQLLGPSPGICPCVFGSRGNVIFHVVGGLHMAFSLQQHKKKPTQSLKASRKFRYKFYNLGPIFVWLCF